MLTDLCQTLTVSQPTEPGPVQQLMAFALLFSLAITLEVQCVRTDCFSCSFLKLLRFVLMSDVDGSFACWPSPPLLLACWSAHLGTIRPTTGAPLIEPVTCYSHRPRLLITQCLSRKCSVVKIFALNIPDCLYLVAESFSCQCYLTWYRSQSLIRYLWIKYERPQVFWMR